MSRRASTAAPRTKKKTTEVITRVPGDMGGRGPHPHHPEDYSPNHWPKAMPHEKADWKGWPDPDAVKQRETPVVTGPMTKANDVVKKTATGLITLADFVKEAKLLEVYSKELHGKFEKAFAEAPNEGMKRMRCNNLLNNAVRRKSKC